MENLRDYMNKPPTTAPAAAIPSAMRPVCPNSTWVPALAEEDLLLLLLFVLELLLLFVPEVLLAEEPEAEVVALQTEPSRLFAAA